MANLINRRATDLESGDVFKVYNTRNKVVSVHKSSDGMIRASCRVFQPVSQRPGSVLREVAGTIMTIPAERVLEIEVDDDRETICLSSLCEEDWE
jgi:hypothetical protein